MDGRSTLRVADGNPASVFRSLPPETLATPRERTFGVRADGRVLGQLGLLSQCVLGRGNVMNSVRRDEIVFCGETNCGICRLALGNAGTE
jgi:hypothetical protein